jgi:site-specific DNA recombinase
MLMNAVSALQPPAAAPVMALASTAIRITALYIRLTRDESLKGLSAEAQKENGRAYARRAGLESVKIYEEHRAVGGDVPFEQRDAARRLIDDIRAGRVGAVVVRDLDRIARDMTLWEQFCQLCHEHGVELHTLSGRVAIKSPSDKFAGRVRAAAAALERDQTGDRVRRVKRAMAQHGRHVGGPPPYGYTSQARRRQELIAAGATEDDARIRAETELHLRGHLYVDEREAAIVRQIFDWYVHKRWGCRRIANELNAAGHRRRSGLLWCSEKVRRVVNDPAIAAFIPYDEEYFESQRGSRTPKHRQTLHRGKHDPIISEKLWQRAQAIKTSNTCHHLGKGKAAYANRRYALSGILRCACGAAMSAKGARRGKPFGYYVCVKRKYRGAHAVGGCAFPQFNTDRTHDAFWSGLSTMITSKDLVDRVHAAAQRLLEARRQRRADQEDSGRALRKLDADIALWYRRHDGAQSEVEQEAAWKRIVELTQTAKQLRAQTPQTNAASPAIEPITRDRVARYLKSLSALVGQTEDAGKSFVASLVEHHGLTVTAADAKTLRVKMRLRPPGANGDGDDEFAVELDGDARLPADRITAWVAEHQAKARSCACGCGRPVEIRRRHYWLGVPEFRSQCRHKGMSRKRAQLAAGFYTGQQVADRLCINRTTMGRWLKASKLPKPSKSISGMLLFDRAAIDALAASSTMPRT